MKKCLVLAIAFSLAACGAADKKEAADGAQKEEAGSSEMSAGGSGEAITGVAECDQYLNKVMACVKDKVPAAQRSAMEQAIEQSKASWKAIPDKAQLAQTCKTAMDQAKASYTAMGCQF